MKKLLLLPAVALLGVALYAGAQTSIQKLRMAESAISQLYVDTVNEDKLVEEAIRGMLSSLDPHSSYSTVEETREMNEPLEGNFSGVGITYNMVQDTLYVIQTVAGGPAERVGMLAGDRVIKVDTVNIAGRKKTTRELQGLIRGPKGTEVDLKVLRSSGGKPDTIDFRITRADIPIYSIDANYMVDDKTGYIRLSRFAADTPKEMREAITKLKKQGMTQLILDLTDNGGGYLSASVDLLGELLSPGSMTVYTEGINSPRQTFKAKSKGFSPLFEDGRLVVMVNQFSASASEITSGAIQDWDRGVIVGRRTFGKGLVQRPIPFPDGSMMRLTVAHYYTPTGRDIQKPYDKGNKKSYDEDLLDRLNSGELMHADSIHYVDSLRVQTLRNNRPIYGGGGISPDRFVALDTTANTKYYRAVMAKGLFNRFVVNYVDKNRKQLKSKYRTDDAFAKNFEVTDEMIDELLRMADAEKIERNEEQIQLSTPLFKTVLKSLIGRDLFESATYYKVYNSYDPIFKEAYRLINSDEYDTILNPKK